jgi:hypothetical protein
MVFLRETICSDAAQIQIQKVLLSLLAATIVAVSEVGLYIIWESRRRQSQRGKAEVNRLHPQNAYAAGDSNSGDVGVGEASSEPVHLDSAPSQASTSIDHSPVSARTTLRQRVGATAKLVASLLIWILYSPIMFDGSALQ